MNNSRPTIPQVLSAGAVVLSLVFVGIEISQNTAAQRAQTRQALADAAQEFAMTLAGDAELARAWDLMWRANPDDIRLTTVDTLRASMAMTAQLRRLENVFLQSREGVVSADVLSTYGFGGSPFYRSDVFRSFWNVSSSGFDTAFVRAFAVANGLD